jgi:hypothetical protein
VRAFESKFRRDHGIQDPQPKKKEKEDEKKQMPKFLTRVRIARACDRFRKLELLKKALRTWSQTTFEVSVLLTPVARANAVMAESAD